MSIKDTKELIGQMPQVGQWAGYDNMVVREFNTDELKALATNHTRLLTAIKKYLSLNDHGTMANAEMIEKELKDAIAEAES